MQLCADFNTLPMGTFKASNGQVFTMPDNQRHCEISNQQTVFFQSSNIPSNAINGGQVEFKVQTAPLHDVRRMYLQLAITNTDGTNTVTLANAHHLIQKVQIYAENGNKQIGGDIYGHKLWLSQAIMYTSDEWTDQCEVTNCSSSFGAGTAIPAGATVTYYIPIDCLFSQLDVFFPAIKSDFLVRVFFQPLTASIEAGTGTPSLTMANLVFQINELSTIEYDQKMAAANSSTITARFTYDAYQSNTFSMGASGSYQYQLSGVVGTVDYLLLSVRAATNTAAGQRTLADINGSFAILNSAGQNIVGGQAIPSRYNRFIQGPYYFDSVVFKTVPVLFWSHSSDPQEVYHHAKLLGFSGYDGTNQLILNTGTGVASQAYTVDVYASVHGTIQIKNGRIEVFNS